MLFRVIKGIKYSQHDEKPETQKLKSQKIPITFELLVRILNHLNNRKKTTVDIYSHHSNHLCSVIFTIAFNSGARPSDLAISNMRKTHKKPLLLQHLSWNTSGEQFTILQTSAKADQFGTRSDMQFGQSNHALACPVLQLRSWIKLRQRQGEKLTNQSYLFPCRQTDGSLGAMNTYQFRAALSKVLTEIGETANPRAKNFSFRTGLASTAAARGISDAGIQAAGRWKSQTYLRYVRPSRESGAQLASLISGIPAKPSGQRVKSSSAKKP
jgi:hypothetical protein